MEQKKLSNWLKLIIIGIAICGLLFYSFVIPSLGQAITHSYPEFTYRFWPWLIFIWLTAIPCFAVLVFAWKIATNIGLDLSFSDANAKLLKNISFCAAGDAFFLFVGNIILLLLGMNHPGILLGCFFFVFIGISISIASAVLSHLVQKASVLQEQSDLTI